jgi:hypothetical protein
MNRILLCLQLVHRRKPPRDRVVDVDKGKKVSLAEKATTAGQKAPAASFGRKLSFFFAFSVLHQ